MNKLLGRTTFGILGWAGCLLLFLPLGYMVLKSFQTETDAAAPSPRGVSRPPRWTAPAAGGRWGRSSCR